jgi:hypothetical protein
MQVRQRGAGSAAAVADLREGLAQMTCAALYKHAVAIGIEGAGTVDAAMESAAAPKAALMQLCVDAIQEPRTPAPPAAPDDPREGR